MKERNRRTVMLIGEEAFGKIECSRVAVFGLGGVGGHAVDALVRAGIGEIDLFDNDTVSESNINRQLIATYKTLGMSKTEAFRERIETINPECRVNLHTVFVTPELVKTLELEKYDYVIDAIDTVSAKLALAEAAAELNVPIISSMGTGNKLDPTKLVLTDIYKTSVCPLARVMRTELRKRGVRSLRVLYSTEEPRHPFDVTDEASPAPCDEKRKKSTPASISFVPSAAGLLLASEVINYLIGEKNG